MEQLVPVVFKAKLVLRVQVAYRARSEQLVQVAWLVLQDHKDHKDQPVQVVFKVKLVLQVQAAYRAKSEPLVHLAFKAM